MDKVGRDEANRCLECGRRNRRKYYKVNKKKLQKKDHSRKRFRRYGIDQIIYERMLKEQNHKCAICGGVNVSGRSLSIDHCHETGKVRGLLCSLCNTLLGVAKDNVRILRRAMEYLT